MDCSICTTMPFILRPPRNTICAACYEGGKNLITLTNKLEADNINSCNSKGGSSIDKSSSVIASSTSNSPNSAKGFANALKWVKEMKEMEEEYKERLNFLSNFVTAFRHEIHPDIQIKPGNNGTNAPSISAHRALLAVRSDIFRNMLDSDGYKSAPSESISLPEFSYEELDSLLEFLYSGTLSKEKAEKHLYSLSVAADKYDIAYLQKFCENRMLGNLNATNALDVLEIADICSNQTLKEAAINFIVKNMEDVVFSARFDAFALKNPHLIVHITRASFMDIKNRRNVV